MTLREVAHYLNCHPITVYRLIQRSTLPAFRIGSEYRIRRADLEKWMQQQSVVPGPEPKVAKARPKSRA